MSVAMPSMQHLSTSQRGMTLVETVIVVSIVAVVGTALMSAIQFFYKSNAYLLEQTAALDSARRGLTFALQNIREASYGDDGSYVITTAATSTVTFYSDIDLDGGVERVRFYLQNNTLYRGTTNASGNPATYTGQTEGREVVATFVKNATSTPIFTYYGTSGTALTAPVNVSDIAAVGIRLDVDLNPYRAPNVFTISGKATLRNLRVE